MVTKNEKDWRVLEYFVPITETVASNSNGEFIIKGAAINEGVTRNGVMYEADELQKAAPTLVNKPLLKDHVNSVDNIVGKVKTANFSYANKNIAFEAKIIDKKMQEMITDGRIENVSIGAMVEDIVMNEGEDFVTAKGLSFVELSLVAVPGDPGASFAKACLESFKLKEAYSHKIVEADKVKMVCEKCGKEAMAMPGDKCPDCGGPMKPNDMEDEKMSDDTEKIKKELSEAQEKLKAFESEKAKVAEEKRINEEVEKRLAAEKAKLEEAVAAQKVADAKKNETKGVVGAKPTNETVKDGIIVVKAKQGFSFSKENYDSKLSRFQR